MSPHISPVTRLLRRFSRKVRPAWMAFVLALTGAMAGCNPFEPSLTNYRDVSWTLIRANETDVQYGWGTVDGVPLGSYHYPGASGDTVLCSLNGSFSTAALWGWVEEEASGKVVAITPTDQHDPPYEILNISLNSVCSGEPPLSVEVMLGADIDLDRANNRLQLTHLGATGAVRQPDWENFDVESWFSAELATIALASVVYVPIVLRLTHWPVVDGVRGSPALAHVERLVTLRYERRESVHERSSP